MSMCTRGLCAVHLSVYVYVSAVHICKWNLHVVYTSHAWKLREKPGIITKQLQKLPVTNYKETSENYHNYRHCDETHKEDFPVNPPTLNLGELSN